VVAFRKFVLLFPQHTVELPRAFVQDGKHVAVGLRHVGGKVLVRHDAFGFTVVVVVHHHDGIVAIRGFVVHPRLQIVRIERDEHLARARSFAVGRQRLRSAAARGFGLVREGRIGAERNAAAALLLDHG